MPGSGELSVVTVVALVLGGLAAVVLAVVVANKDAQRLKTLVPAPSVSAASLPPPTPSAEIEIPAELLYPDAGTASEP